MKKTTRKFVLRKQTVRELSGEALTHVLGGQDTPDAVPFSGTKVCLTSAFIAALDGGARDNG